MTDVTHVASSRAPLAPPVPLILGRGLSFFWPAADALVIVGLALLAGAAYHLAVYHAAGHIPDYAKVGAIIALLTDLGVNLLASAGIFLGCAVVAIIAGLVLRGRARAT